MAKPAKGLDLIIAMGGKKKPPMDEEGPADAPMDDGELPMDFEAAYEDYKKNPSAQALYDCIEACKSGK